MFKSKKKYKYKNPKNKMLIRDINEPNIIDNGKINIKINNVLLSIFFIINLVLLNVNNFEVIKYFTETFMLNLIILIILIYLNF